jgi:hypothetical protein
MPNKSESLKKKSITAFAYFAFKTLLIPKYPLPIILLLFHCPMLTHVCPYYPLFYHSIHQLLRLYTLLGLHFYYLSW